MESIQETSVIFRGIEYKNYPINVDKFASFQIGNFVKGDTANNKTIYFIEFIIPGIAYENNIYWYYEKPEVRDIDVKFLTDILNGNKETRSYDHRKSLYDEYKSKSKR